MRVLIIDDEEDTRQIACMSLSLLGGLDVMKTDRTVSIRQPWSSLMSYF